MFEILALVGTIILILLVQTLRTVLALPFARESVRFVDAAAPNGARSLFDEAHAQLVSLGFSGPRWIMTSRIDGTPSTVPLRAVYADAEGTLFAIAPPIDAAKPHTPLSYFASRLQDGRMAISQAFDPYYELTQTEEIVARTASESDLSTLWAAHRSWVAPLGAVRAPVDDAAMLDLIGGLMDRQRQALLARGDLRAVSADLAVPRPAFAWRILQGVRRAPKPAADPRPIPAERLVLLARNLELTQQRSPPRSAQWALFAISVVLFMALGALFWGLRFAGFILLVVLIHELGHFLAMRAFGYRNVHLMALPLVGGVAMGVDANPGATRRAWMSLMGPLPGILIGWVLLVITLQQTPNGFEDSWLYVLALIFLFVNYLNVLPVPPLDGAQVFASLLPPRWARVEAVFLATAAVIGGLVAWYLGFVLLTLLAGLQLFRIPVLWRQHSVEGELSKDPEFARAHRSLRLLRVLQSLETKLGPARLASQRINMALGVLLRLDTRPMGLVSRLLTGAVYIGLLVVPVLGLMFASTFFSAADSAEQQHAMQEAEILTREQTELQAQARTLSIEQLLSAHPTDSEVLVASEQSEKVRKPGTQAQSFMAAEQRLGSAFPQELRALYEADQPGWAKRVLPIDELQLAKPLLDAEVQPYTDALLLTLTESQNDVVLPLDAAARWWHLAGSDSEWLLFYLPEAEPRLPGVRIVQYNYESAEGFASVRDWLEYRWVQEEQSQRSLDRYRTQSDAARKRFAQASVSELLDHWQPPGLMVSLLAAQLRWPGGAEEAVRRRMESKLGQTLPADYWELLNQHDGFPPTQLLPLAKIQRWPDVSPYVPEYLREVWFWPRHMDESIDSVDAKDPVALETEALAACFLVAGAEYPDGDGASQVHASLLWCPDHTPQPGWYDLHTHARHPNFRAWFLERSLRPLIEEGHGQD